MERVKKPKPRRMRLSSVANAVRLTKAFSEQEYEMGISALATRLGLAKSTVHRLATTLVEYDMLEQNRETGKYRLGLAFFELGTLVRRKMDAATEAQGEIHALAERRQKAGVHAAHISRHSPLATHFATSTKNHNGRATHLSHDERSRCRCCGTE